MKTGPFLDSAGTQEGGSPATVADELRAHLDEERCEKASVEKVVNVERKRASKLAMPRVSSFSRRRALERELWWILERCS